MAKGKYSKWLEKDNLLRLKSWARDGLTDEEIAKKMEISPSTFYEWQKKYSEISEAIKKGREPVNTILEDTAFERATQWREVEEVAYERQYNMQSKKMEMVEVRKTKKTIPPDATLLIFLLKARMKEKYGDKQKIELSGAVETNPYQNLTEEELRKLAGKLKK